MKKFDRDGYWIQTKRIHLIQYLTVIIFIIAAYIGFSSFIFPTFGQCRFYKLENQTYLLENITKLEISEVQTTINIHNQSDIQSFQVQQLKKDDQTLFFTRTNSYCATMELELNLSLQNLTIEVDYLSPMRLSIIEKQFDDLIITSPHFAGFNSIYGSFINFLNINTESSITIQNSIVNETEIFNAQNIEIINSTIKVQNIITGGTYRYVQLDDDQLQLHLHINSAGLHEKHRICVPRKAVSGKCIQTQNKYWTGNVGVKYFVDQVQQEEVTKDKNNPKTVLYSKQHGEITQVCVDKTEWDDEPAIKTFNRAESLVFIFDGEVPVECYQ